MIVDIAIFIEAIRHKILPAICGDILHMRYILTCENVCNIDIAYPNIA